MRTRDILPFAEPKDASGAARHIAIVMHDFPAGGTEIIAFKLARCWVAAGRRVTIICGAHSGALAGQIPVGVAVVPMVPAIPRSLFSRIRLRRALAPYVRSLAPDVLFLTGNFHFALAGGVPRAGVPGWRRPVVVSKVSNPVDAHDLAPLRWVMRRAFRTVASGTDWFVAMSSGLAADAVAADARARASVIFDPNIDGDGPAIVAQRATTAAAKPARVIRLLAAGRLVAQKDFALALRTAAALHRHHPVQLTILGDGPDRAALVRLAARLGIADHVALPGHLPSIVPALADADILLITSRYEGGPAVAIEALSRDVPVVTTDCSHFLRDMLQEKGFGSIVAGRDPQALAQAVVELMRLRPPVTATGRQMLASCRTDIAADRYLQLFDRLVAPPRQRSP